jgi:hypothetical protein
MTEPHQFVAAAAAIETIALLVTSLWSALEGRRTDGARDRRGLVDRLVLVLTATIAVALVIGIVLVVAGRRPADPLHLLYAAVVLVTPIGGWWLGGRRLRGADRGSPAGRVRRDAWLTVTAIVLIGLEVRLLMTG